MTSLVSAAPGGASMPGTEIAGPPGCANGTGGRSNRSRSRPGWSLGGTICAPGGTTCATAANETLTIAKAAAMARTHASMPPTLDERAEILRYGGTRSQRRQLSVSAILPGVSKRSHRLAAMLQVAGRREASGELLSRPRYPGQTHSRAVHGDQVGHRGERPDQANRDHDGDSHHPCAHLHPLYVALSLPRGLHIFRRPQREVVHKCAKFFGARAAEDWRMTKVAPYSWDNERLR